jgi:hypothetical protein
MPNAQLLVPGTGGITLMDNAGKDLGYPVKMRLGVLSARLAKLPSPDLLELLSMEHRPGQIAPALEAEIMGAGTATAFDVLARAKVQKM